MVIRIAVVMITSVSGLSFLRVGLLDFPGRLPTPVSSDSLAFFLFQVFLLDPYD